jgi:small subunit ribosomal protein S5
MAVQRPREERGPRRGEVIREEKEFEQKILDLARVTRVTKGGKRMRFRATVVVGDKKSHVGFGVAKGNDVTLSVNKAARDAKRNLITIPLKDETIPYSVTAKFGASVVLLRPAPQGTGIKAGGAVRTILELAGVPNASAKIMRGKNKINTLKATMAALLMFKRRAS